MSAAFVAKSRLPIVIIKTRLPPPALPPPVDPSQSSGRKLPPPPEIVTNVQGSSAGAGSGEFHVYKAARRREYERLRLMDEEVAREKARSEFENTKREKETKDEERTRKNREKREKKKKAAEMAALKKKQRMPSLKRKTTCQPQMTLMT